MRPEPFSVAIDADLLADMRRRLRATRWAEDFGNDDWAYGVEGSWLKEMVDYWADAYDWRAQEAAINHFPQFRVTIDGIPIHYLHVRGKGPNPLPIILTHGWPWTFWDYKDVIEPLTDPARFGGDPNQSFDVIVPSLPGYGFSSPLRTTGVNVRAIAALWARLMRDVLGYPRFAAAGGDWGAVVTAEMGHSQPDGLAGIYLTMPHGLGVVRLDIREQDFAPDEAWMAARMMESRPLVASHVTAHVSDPQTLAYAMSDSPVGTAAWLWERRRAWSDCGGDVLRVFDRDALCTLASIYWLTNSIGTSFRLYAEQFRRPWTPVHDRSRLVDVPTGVAILPREVALIPRAFLETRYNMQRYTLFPRGGHFAAAEVPELVVDELRAFFAPYR